MPRFCLFLLVGGAMVFVARHVSLLADPPDADTGFHNTLVVQRALEQARYCLEEGNSQKAVQILEEHLSRINGNATYLRLLRDAYRAHIRDLYLAQQTATAQKYVARLSILDRDAANDPTLRPAAMAPPVSDNKTLTLAEKGSKLVKQLLPRPLSLLPQQPKSPTVRAKIEEDPFDQAFQHELAGNRDRNKAVRLLGQAEDLYGKRRFSEAGLLYEQAHKADDSTISDSKARWAYCKLHHVVEQINRSDLETALVPKLEREVRLAMEMAPSLKDTGLWLLQKIGENRSGRSVKEAAVTVRHVGRDSQGWDLTESPSFRIHHRSSAELSERVARTAEHTRLAISRKWLGTDGPAWTDKCDIFLHPGGQEYYRATGVRPETPGHADIQTDKSNGRIAARRIHLHCDVPNMLQAVLPHEATHVVLAGQFGSHALPRWADEGIAVLAEPDDRIAQHRQNLSRSHSSRELFGIRELMQLPDWPAAKRISAFYAQSVYLVDYLSRQRGPRAFTEFLRDGLQTGYEPALQKHYGFRDFNDLQGRWQQDVLAGRNQKETPVASRR